MPKDGEIQFQGEGDGTNQSQGQAKATPGPPEINPALTVLLGSMALELAAAIVTKY